MPNYHGLFVILSSLLPCIIFLIVFISIDGFIKEVIIQNHLPNSLILLGQEEVDFSVSILRNNIHNLQSILSLEILSTDSANSLYNYYFFYRAGFLTLTICITTFLAYLAGKKLNVRFDARRNVEKILKFIFFVFSIVAVLTTFGIILSLIFETVRFFSQVSFSEFLFGIHWSPQTAIREGQVGSSGSFGAIPIFTGTLLITAISMLIAVPLGLYSAIYLSQYARPKIRNYFN